MNARSVIEAETPKGVLRAFSRGVIKPGRGYWLNIANADQPWEEGEFCPAEITPVNQLNTLDGLYGLTDDVIKAIKRTDPNFNYNRDEDRWVAELDKYEEPMWSSIRRGVTSGTVNGIDGPKKWRLVFQPGNAEPIQAAPGADYPTEPLLGEAETPKSVFRQMRGGHGSVDVTIFRSARPGHHGEAVGQVRIFSNGNAVVTGESPGEDEIKRIYRDLKRGVLNGALRDSHLYWHISKHPTSYGMSAELVGNFVNNAAPVLVVTNGEWTIRGPLLVDDEFYHYTWWPRNLTPEQKAFMEEHGEFIFYGMNEGPEFEGDIHEYPDPDGDEVTVGHWHVEGNPELAPETHVPRNVGYGG